MKQLLILLFVILSFSLSAQTELTEGLKPAPTIENCGCLRLKAVKVSSKGKETEGEVIIYNNMLIFQFGSYLAQFWSTDVDQVWQDKKESIYLLKEVKPGIWAMKVKTTTLIVIQDDIAF